MAEFVRVDMTAFTVRNFSFGMDFDGRLVLRLWYQDAAGQKLSPAFCFEPEQDVQFGRGLLIAMQEIGKHRGATTDTKQ